VTRIQAGFDQIILDVCGWTTLEETRTGRGQSYEDGLRNSRVVLVLLLSQESCDVSFVGSHLVDDEVDV